MPLTAETTAGEAISERLLVGAGNYIRGRGFCFSAV